MKNKFLYTIVLSFLAALCLPSITQSNSLFFPQEACAQDTELSDSEVLVARWQHLLDTTGKLHIPFDPEGLTVTTVGKQGVTTACRYNVDDSLHITPDFDYEISSDPRVEVHFKGEEGSSFICYDENVTNSPWTGRLYIHDLTVKAGGADFVSAIKTTGFKMAFNKPIFERLTFSATGYAFDFKDVDYTIVPVFRDITTAGGGALRFTSTGGGSNGFHSTSQMEIISWHHNGGNRVGPAFDLWGTGGLVMTNIIDEQRADLHPRLKGIFKGPLSIRVVSSYDPIIITNYWNEWWGDVQKVAPGCWAAEFRTDSRTGDGKKEMVFLNNFTTGGNGTCTQPQLRFVGGNDARAHNLTAVIRGAWKPNPERIGLYAKTAIKFEYPYGNGNDQQTKKKWADNTRVYWEDLITGPTHFPPTFDEDVNLRQSENAYWVYGYSDRTPYYEDLLKPAEPDPIGPEDGSGTDSTKSTGDQ